MKRVLVFLLLTLTLTVNACAVDIYVDTKKIETDTPPTIVDGRMLVPLRAIFEALGADVTWDAEARVVIATRNGTRVWIQIDSSTAYLNGEPQVLDVPAQLVNNRTMVPARFVSEALWCDVSWYPETQTAAVSNILKGQVIYATPTGERYHFDGSCNGGTYYPATWAEIHGRGLTPCSKCVLTNSRYIQAENPSIVITPANPKPTKTDQPNWLF